MDMGFDSEMVERELLGVLMLDGGQLRTVSWVVDPDHFASLRHQCLYTCLLALERDGIPIDFVSVGEWLKDDIGTFKWCGGNEWLIGLVPSEAPTNGPAACLELRAKVATRSVIESACARRVVTELRRARLQALREGEESEEVQAHIPGRTVTLSQLLYEAQIRAKLRERAAPTDRCPTP